MQKSQSQKALAPLSQQGKTVCIFGASSFQQQAAARVSALVLPAQQTCAARGAPLAEVEAGDENGRKCLGRAGQKQVSLYSCQHPPKLQSLFQLPNTKTNNIQPDSIFSRAERN